MGTAGASGGAPTASSHAGSRGAVAAGAVKTQSAAQTEALGTTPLTGVDDVASTVAYTSSPRTVRVAEQRPVIVAQAATPAATDAPAASTAQDNGGIPWWVWLLLALIIIGIILWLLNRRKKDPVGSTSRGRDDPIIKTRK